MTVLVFFFADLSAPAAVFLAVGVAATASIPVLLLPDAHRSDFPRLWQAAVDARHDVDRAYASGLRLAADAVLYARLTLRDAAFTAAALLALLFPVAGGTR